MFKPGSIKWQTTITIRQGVPLPIMGVKVNFYGKIKCNFVHSNWWSQYVLLISIKNYTTALAKKCTHYKSADVLFSIPTGQPPALHVTPKFTTDRQYISYYQRYSPRGICLGSRRPRGNFLAGSASPRPHTVTWSCDRSWLGLEGSALPRLGSNQST